MQALPCRPKYIYIYNGCQSMNLTLNVQKRRTNPIQKSSDEIIFVQPTSSFVFLNGFSRRICSKCSVPQWRSDTKSLALNPEVVVQVISLSNA